MKMASRKSKSRWNESSPLDENLRDVLPQMTDKWFRAGNAAMQPGVPWEEMHHFRLLTKRFRYTLEIFQPLYGPSLEGRISQLRKLQTHLGDINDCITTRGLLPDEDGSDAVARELQLRAEKKTAELRRFWEKTFGGAGAVAAWKNYLTRYAGRGAAQKG
jgi:CHAD domain-containing protein